MNKNLFKKYTSSAMLAGLDEKKLTERSIKYYNARIIPFLPKNKKIKILELGCGYGRFLKALAEKNYTNAIGVDISQEQISYAKNILNINNVEVCDAIKFLKGGKDKYDAIILLDVLEHLNINQSISLIRLVNKSLKGDGIFIVQVPNALNPLTLMSYTDITHYRHYTVHSLHQSMILGGFNQVKYYELPVAIMGIKTFVQYLVYKLIIKPIISLYMYSMIGYLMGGLFTPNILATASKDSRFKNVISK